jgi:hypothetical protein
VLGYRSSAAALAVVALSGVLVACSSDDDGITSKQASAQLDAQLTKLQERLTRSGTVAVPWHQATRSSSAPFCDRGEVRRAAVATVDVTTDNADGDSAYIKTVGMLDELGWHAGVGAGDLDDDPVALVDARRGGDATRLDLTVTVERREPAWHYVLTVITGCHPGKSG